MQVTTRRLTETLCFGSADARNAMVFTRFDVPVRVLGGTIEMIPITPAANLKLPRQQNGESERDRWMPVATARCVLKHSNGTPNDATATTMERLRTRSRRMQDENQNKPRRGQHVVATLASAKSSSRAGE